MARKKQTQGVRVRDGINAITDQDAYSKASGLACVLPTRTVQSEKDDADINVILDRFGITGALPQNVRPPTFADYGDTVFDFQTAMNAINAAVDSFMQMPARVRARFEHDPQKFVEFCSDEKNLPEMRELGLAVPAPKPPDPSPAKPA